MPRIVRVGALDGNTLEVQLDNGNVILLNAALLLAKPEFAPLAADDRILYPHTDGGSLYWNHGPNLCVDDLVALVAAKATKEEKQ